MNKLYLLMKRLFNMKKLYPFVVILILLSLTGNSQDFKNEIGINIFKYSAGFTLNPNLYAVRAQFLITEIGQENLHLYSDYIGFGSPHIFYSRQLTKSFSVRTGGQFMRHRQDEPRYMVLNNPNFIELTGYQRKQINTYYLENGLQYILLPNRKLQPYIFGLTTMQVRTINSLNLDISGREISLPLKERQFELNYKLGAGLHYKFAYRFSSNIEFSTLNTFNSHFLSRLSINYHF